mgnify:FL=1
MLVKDLNALINTLTDTKEMEPIERDILLEKIRKAYEIAGKIPESQPIKINPVSEVQVEPNQPEETLSMVDPQPADDPAESESHESEPVSEKRAEEFSRSKQQSTPATLFDISNEETSQEPASSVHERISDQGGDVSLEEKLKKNPVEDLKKSIGINEKFSFINELFEGDLNSYNDTIDQLNSCEDLNTAKELLLRTAQELSWEEDSETMGKLSDLVERRFVN